MNPKMMMLNIKTTCKRESIDSNDFLAIPDGNDSIISKINSKTCLKMN